MLSIAVDMGWHIYDIESNDHW